MEYATGQEDVHGEYSPPTAMHAVLGFDDVEPLCRRAGWIKFFGVLLLVVGVLYCLTIVGIIFGWLPIWIGVLLLKSSTNLRDGYFEQDRVKIWEGMRALGTVILIYGIMTIISFVFSMLYFVFIIMMMFAIAGSP